MISESEVLFWMSAASVSIAKQTKAIKYCGGITEVWNKMGSDDKLREIFDNKYDLALRYRSEQFIANCMEKLRVTDVKVMSIYNPYYSERLRQPEVGAPYVFYYKGNPKLFSSECIAVVGTRACSQYGKIMTEKIAGTLAENGITVVSGLATGVDMYAHSAALEAKGNTIAVLGSGFNKFSPQSNQRLFERILESGGAIMSEYTPNTVATPYTFPERNRLISGLSKGVCVVEAAKKSGALITAKFALEQNRDVFAVPGNVGNARSEGPNNLLFDGALMARSGEDILNHYGVSVRKSKADLGDVKDENAKKILNLLLNEDSVSFDDIVEKLELSPSLVSVKLTELEIEGRIRKVSNNEFAIIGE